MVPARMRTSPTLLSELIGEAEGAGLDREAIIAELVRMAEGMRLCEDE